MLADAPQSFGDRLEDVRTWGRERWRARLASALMDDSALLVAVDVDGVWVGQMAAREYLHPAPARVWLLEVYVTPAHRSSGLAEVLLSGIEAWTLDRGHHRLHLDVHEDSGAARSFYLRMGFVESGRTQPYPLDTTRRELEMVKDLP